MHSVYKVGAYLTAAVHTVYVPATLLTFVRPDPGDAAAINFGVCITGLTVGFFVRYCPLTFIEKWFRRRYDPAWVFPGAWVRYYGLLAWGVLTGQRRKLLRGT